MNPYWHGMLCAETVAQIVERLNAVLAGQHFTIVTANSYDENSERFLAIDVKTSQRLTREVRPTSNDNDGWIGIGWNTPAWSMGVHTRALTQADARSGSRHGQVAFSFEPSEITIDHYAPAGYRLRWILALEHHDEDDS